jgi:secreted trypsin-like serine protease
MSNKTSLLIGNNDINLKSVNSSKGAQRQGITRVDRANSYFESLVNISDDNNIPFRWSYKVVDEVDHDYLKMTPVAAKILLEDVSSFD